MQTDEVRAYRKEFYRNVEQRQALDPRQHDFYVPLDSAAVRGTDIQGELLELIEFSTSGCAIALGGPRGSGKTSELLRLGERLTAAGNPFLYASVEDSLKPSQPLDGGLYLIAVAAGLIDAIDVGGGGWDGPGLGRRLVALLKRVRLDVTDFGIEAAPGPIKLSAKFRPYLTEDASFKRQVADLMQSGRRGFREELHQFIGEAAEQVQGSGDKLPVFVFDSTDHWRGDQSNYMEVRDSVDRVFQDMGEELTLPGLHVVYGVPTYVKASWAAPAALLNVKVVEADRETVFGPGIEQLRRILAKRAPDGDAATLLGANVDRVAQTSGGLFRDLFRLTGQAILAARSGGLPISDDKLAEAERKVRYNLSAGFYREQWDILNEVATDRQFSPGTEQAPAFDYLESIGAILRYPNGSEPWVGIHPLLWPRLKS
ncbi:MAG: hypothetical protein LBT54_05605 [Bifidobacteriaceae bacterium]|jgi:hypothetical protein|nr:hypothetical protein [Bifidobacteriaceae bacterium]